MNSLTKTLSLIILSLILIACSSTPQGPYATAEENAAFEQQVRQQYLHEIRRYEYNNNPALETQNEYFNNVYRRNPDRILDYNEFYQRQVKLAKQEDPTKQQEEQNLQKNEDAVLAPAPASPFDEAYEQ
ncbi:hypothetical protein [Poriferisphaera sp. WC338]|uniref:hypothetical protein n=1 Tax=Poriferisphaera sp. WC338 TaxID=3425129 RepID=UPI003D818147